MKIHEYQAKAVLSKYGVPVPRGEVAFTPEEVHDIAKRLGGPISVVKAQIHAGGRGKAGGVKLAKSGSEAETIARELLGKTLVTYQTGPERPEGLSACWSRKASPSTASCISASSSIAPRSASS